MSFENADSVETNEEQFPLTLSTAIQKGALAVEERVWGKEGGTEEEEQVQESVLVSLPVPAATAAEGLALTGRRTAAVRL